MLDSHIAYRADIDGLRAAAVLGVIAYHAAPASFPGGFVGVDVFFVISGFLISTIILREIEAGSFSLAIFYARRLRRLLPALAVVLAATALIGWFYLLPHEFSALGKHMLAGTAFFSNFSLKREAGYFDAAAEEKPLLHLWSLGIEEQFYLLWPLLLLAVRNRRALTVAATIIVTASFAACVSTSYRNLSSAFFLPQFRIWELSVGALVALASLHLLEARKLRASVAATLSAAGLALLIAAACILNDKSIYPGYLALWPVAAAVLTIAAGPTAAFNRLILSHPLAVGIGLISYPLYLWHWPLLSIAHILKVEHAPYVTAAIVAGTFILALLTHLFIEKPMRRGGTRVLVPTVMAMTCLAVTGLAMRGTLIEPRLNELQFAELSAAANDWSFPDGLSRDARVKDFKFYRKGNGPGTVVFFGDSHAQQYWPRIQELTLGAEAPPVVFATRGGCPPILGLDYKRKPDCQGLVERTMALALEPEVSTVVFSAVWFIYFDSADFEMQGVGSLSPGSPAWVAALGRLSDEMGSLVSRGKRVYLVLGSPVDLSPFSAFQREPSGKAELRKVELTSADIDRKWGAIRAGLRSAALSAGARIIDPIAAMCKGGPCASTDALGHPIYRDGTHLRASYVRQHATFMDETMDVATGSLR